LKDDVAIGQDHSGRPAAEPLDDLKRRRI
jgi:hypothetical protein